MAPADPACRARSPAWGEPGPRRRPATAEPTMVDLHPDRRAEFMAFTASRPANMTCRRDRSSRVDRVTHVPGHHVRGHGTEHAQSLAHRPNRVPRLCSAGRGRPAAAASQCRSAARRSGCPRPAWIRCWYVASPRSERRGLDTHRARAGHHDGPAAITAMPGTGGLLVLVDRRAGRRHARRRSRGLAEVGARDPRPAFLSCPSVRRCHPAATTFRDCYGGRLDCAEDRWCWETTDLPRRTAGLVGR